MRLKFVYGIFPALIIYTNLLIPAKFAGVTRLFFVFIKPDKKADKGLLEHELVHVRQFYRGIGLLHELSYLCSAGYRYEAELEAYRKQLEFNPGNIALFAQFIATKYDLDVSVCVTRRLLEFKQ